MGGGLDQSVVAGESAGHESRAAARLRFGAYTEAADYSLWGKVCEEFQGGGAGICEIRRYFTSDFGIGV